MIPGSGMIMKNILVAVDFSPVTDTVLDLAFQVGLAFKSPIHVIHVAPPDPDFLGYETGPKTVRDQVARHWHEEHKKLQAYAEGFKRQGVSAKALLIQGVTVEKILEEVKNTQAELIILGSHRHGPVHDVLLGSVSREVLKKAPCPVLVVPGSSRA